MTASPDEVHADGEPDAGAARPPLHLDAVPDDPALAVFRTAEWIPPAYRQAYLDGAASVLGRELLPES